ncbi:MAG TPA: XRE family transcriptional regulator [Polyangiaceae bacterium]|jgi:DNA-binding transcriptional regulator YiaG|nr:XRE family transcriptional regulator [Polyangiaceae bacterium]
MNKTWKSLKQLRLSPEAQARVRARVDAKVEELTLKAMRQELELTQAEVGRCAEMTQSELSRLESRSDHLTSTLRRYVEALGGKLEITAVFGERRVKLKEG